MARFRLRYQSTDLEMQVGEFVVGRSSSCHLALDDALVSRRHATFHVNEHGVDVEDLGSRNGVQVNGEPITGRQPVKHLDRVLIGAQELLLVRVHGAEKRGARPTLAGMTLDLPIIGGADVPDEPTVATSGSVIDRIAEKALALGRFEEAERMLGRRLKSMIEEARKGQRNLAEDKLEGATEYALKLAEGTEKHEWIDWIFEAHDVHDALLAPEVIERLHQLVRKVRYRKSSVFRRYMQNLRARSAQLSKGDQFTLRRLEAVERVVDA